MPPESVWSDQFNKPEIRLNLIGTGWKNLMQKCLIEAEGCIENKCQKECVLSFDPKFVMDERHKMVKESSKLLPAPQEQVQTNALKLLREQFHKKVLKRKEGNLVEMEITRLIQSMENHRLVIRKKLEETGAQAKPSCSKSKFRESHRKLAKGPRCCEAEIGKKKGVVHSVKVEVPPPPGAVRSSVSDGSVSAKRAQEIGKPRPLNKGSLIQEEKGSSMEDERIKIFLENDEKYAQEEFGFDIKKDLKIRPLQEVQNRMKENNIGCAIRKLKRNEKERMTEGKKHGKKIEEFLSRLKENKKKGKRVSERKRQMLEKREKDERSDEALRNLMREVKLCEREAQERLEKLKLRAADDKKFLVKMEERRKERVKRRQEFEERKLQRKKEKEKLEQEREEERKHRYEEKKRMKEEEVKEKRRVEKEKREEEKREREKQRVNKEIAVAHYKVFLVRSYGMRPWRRLMRTRKRQEEEAERFFEGRLKQRTVRRWMENAREQKEWKLSRAVAFYEEILKRTCLAMWLESVETSKKKAQVAADWHELRMSEKAFKGWRQFAVDERSEGRIKEDLAIRHYEGKLKAKYMQKLLEYPELRKLERAKESRKWKWRQRVKEILPDYEPIELSELFPHHPKFF